MSDQPTVCAVMLANGRPEMVARAVKSFRAQTYAANRRMLMILDTGDPWIRDSMDLGDGVWDLPMLNASWSIGKLRNRANELADAGILLHWDSDDWSHPDRIAEQVALLQSSGAECVGYNQMLFWRDPTTCRIATEQDSWGEAWLYQSQIPNYALGTSMCYWRETWEHNPFPDRSEGCDDLYWSTSRRVKIVSVSGISTHPRMIASIHGGNTCAKIDADQKEWRRAEQWDDYCRGVMTL
jgi:hypothetical protein